MNNVDWTSRERLKGWDLTLIRDINEELAKPFDWVTSNCAHLMAVSVRACLGDTHPSLDVLTGMSDEATVKRMDIETILSQYFEVLPSYMLAQQGDLAVITYEGGTAGCVVMDGGMVGKAEKPRRVGLYAFRTRFDPQAVMFKIG